MEVSSTLGVTPDLRSSARRTFMKAAAGAVGVLGGATGRFNISITRAARSHQRQSITTCSI
jgi:hypothetical protein